MILESFAKRKTFLDPSRKEVPGYVKTTIAQIKSWGYRIIKHDYTTYDIFGKFGVSLNGMICTDKDRIFYDETKTSAEIVLGLYRAMREAVGESVIFIACNAISHLSAGIFEIYRTGDDTSGKVWSRTRAIGINTPAFRLCQNNENEVYHEKTNNFRLYDVPNLDLSQPYYDQNAVESLTVGGKLFAVTGDMLIMDNDATTCVMFNKKLADDYSIATPLGTTDLYELTNNGAWTIDALYSSAELVAADLNGNGQMDFIGDRWGFGTQPENVDKFITAAGESIAKVDADGYPILSLNLKRASSILELVGELQSDADVTLLSSNALKEFPDNVWDGCMDKNFIEGRVLFYMAGMQRVTLFRPMEAE